MGVEGVPSAAKQPVLQTPRLLLRPFRGDDDIALQSQANDREIAAMTRSIEHPYPMEDAQNWIALHPQFWRDGVAAIFAICDRHEGKLMGAVGLEICRIDHYAELGYWIGRKFWGQGLATEAAGRVLQFGFEDLGLNRIIGHHMTRNPASGRVMQKIGMQPEGILRRHARKWGEYFDVAIYGILASELPRGS